MTYRKLKNRDGSEASAIQRTNDNGSNSFIMADLANIDWVAYQNWLADGNTPLAAE